MHKILLIILFFSLSGTFGFGQEYTVFVEVSGIRSDTGLIRFALYDHKKQFPNDPVNDYVFEKTLMKEGILNVELNDIPPGIYVISVLDDEDGNGKMKFNLLRFPKEGYGFSNNIKPRLKHPPFNKCTFQISEGETRLKIEIQYFREKA